MTGVKTMVVASIFVCGLAIGAAAQDQAINGSLAVKGPNPWVDVKAPPYNAVCDGVADDTKALQKAINDAAAAHGTLHLPPSFCGITSMLQIPQLGAPASPAYVGMKIEGPSSARSGVGGGIRVLTKAPALTDALEIDALGTVLRDFTIDGVNNLAGKCRNGIVGYVANQAIIENVAVVRCMNDGIKFDELANGQMTSAAAIPVGTQTVTPNSTSPGGIKMGVGSIILVDAGKPAGEMVTISSLTAATFTAIFTKDHSKTPVRLQVKGSNNMATVRDSHLVLNRGWGLEIAGGMDENAMHLENLFLDNNGNCAIDASASGGILLRGFGHTITSGLFEGNCGPPIQFATNAPDESYVTSTYVLHPSDIEANRAMTHSKAAVPIGTQTVIPSSMTPNGVPIMTGMIIGVDTGPNYEDVLLTWTTPETFTANFAKAHNKIPVQLRLQTDFVYSAKGSGNIAIGPLLFNEPGQSVDFSFASTCGNGQSAGLLGWGSGRNYVFMTPGTGDQPLNSTELYANASCSYGLVPNVGMTIETRGSGAVMINSIGNGGKPPFAGGGTGGLEVWSGGGAPVKRFKLNGNGHLEQGAADQDVAGYVRLSAGRETLKFRTPYAFPPSCTASDFTAPDPVQVRPTKTQVVFRGTANHTLSYLCVGNPN